MKLCVLGTGYVGLVAGACLSDSGNQVICVDVDPAKIEKLRQGGIPIYEPGLEEMVLRNIKSKRLSFSTEVASSIAEAKAVFIAVGTPSKEDGSWDLQYVIAAVKSLVEHAKHPLTIILKSTVPVGTADRVRDMVKSSKYPMDVVSNPEFLKEGTAVDDFLKPERVVIGCTSAAAQQMMSDLYAPYIRSGNPILFMSNRSAELSKYAANMFLAMKISFINEMSSISERVGAEIHDIRKVLISDSRIGTKFLYPGCGYGGSCFPKDVQALIQLGKEMGMGLEMFTAVHKVNEKQKEIIFEKISRHFDGKLKGRTIGIWGLSFKPMTDDMREAPSLNTIHKLLEAGANVRAYDPVAMDEAKKIFSQGVAFVESAEEAVQSSDALAILTEWNEFKKPNFEFLKNELKEATIFDGRNLYEPVQMQKQGFTYYCIGKRDPK